MAQPMEVRKRGAGAGGTRRTGLYAPLCMMHAGGREVEGDPMKSIVTFTALMTGAAAFAQPAAINPAVAFGAREGVEQASLSPDGKKIALLAAGQGQSTILYTLDTTAPDAAPKRILASSGKPERLTRCDWVANDRLACRIYGITRYAGETYGFSNIIAVDAGGGNLKQLSQQRGRNAIGWDFRGGSIVDLLPKEDGSVLMMRSYVPEGKIGSLIAKDDEGMGVDRIDTRTGRTQRVETPRNDAERYISDGRGEVRIVGMSLKKGDGYDSGQTRFNYRRKGDKGWDTLTMYNDLTGEGFWPVAVDPDKDVVYGFERIDGRNALRTLSLDGRRTAATVFAHKEVDVDALIRVGREGRVVGVSYATERRQAHYFDPSVGQLLSSLSRALGGDKNLHLADLSADGNRALVWAGSDVDPGQYYLYDRAAKQLSPVMPDRPELTGVKLGQMKAVSYRAADGTMVPAYLTTPADAEARNLPAVVMPHGGPASRDEWGFDWLVQYFVARGFAVLQPNFRGSAGYGDGWFVQNGFKSWRIAVGDVVDAGKWLVSEGIADPSKLTIAGWSYGGYAALQSAVVEPDLFKAVVAIAPVTDFAGLTRDAAGWSNYYVTRDYIGTGPHLREGSPAQNVERIRAPVLMFHGTVDGNVDIAQSRLMDGKLKSAGKRSELVVFEDLDHSLIDSNARQQMLQKSGDFLLAAGK